MSEIVAESHYQMVGFVDSRLIVSNFQEWIDSRAQLVSGRLAADVVVVAKRHDVEAETMRGPIDVGQNGGEDLRARVVVVFARVPHHFSLFRSASYFSILEVDSA